jgi:hypothetical protein
VLALASALAGLHAASHIGAPLISSAAADTPPAPADNDPGTTHHGDCPVCRLAGNWTFALAVAALLALLVPLVAGMPLERAAVRCPVDVTVRWLQRRKHGPPSLSR